MAGSTAGRQKKMIANINHNQTRSTLLSYQSTSLEVSSLSSSTDNGARATTTDTISLRSESLTAVTYSGDLKLTAGDEAKFGMLQNLVANLLKEQGISTKIPVGEGEIDLAELTPTQAQDLVSEDGYFGVDQTSERIFQFAVGIAGGDPARIDAIKEGIDKGFAEAKKAFGDWLPDISYDTYDAVMQKLDDWVAASKTVA
jgi:hypothetical protein